MSAPVTIDLRPHQLRWVADVQTAFRTHRRVLGQAPTGMGKSACATVILRDCTARNHRSLFVCELEEIALDTHARLRAAGVDTGLIAGCAPRSPSAPVQVALVQSLAAMLRRGEPLPAADRIIVDEAHNCSATEGGMYASVLEHYPSARILGVTATPCGGLPFDVLVPGPTVSELIAGGWLARVSVIGPAAEMPSYTLSQDPVEAWVAWSQTPAYTRAATTPGAPVATLVFAANRAHAGQIIEGFAARGVAAELLTGATPTAQRRGLRERLTTGRTRVAVVVDAPWEGFDAPTVGCVIFARRVGSLRRWFQGTGRAMRCPPGSTKVATVLDLTGSIHAHGLVTDPVTYSLDGEGMTRVAPPDLRRCTRCHALFGAADAVAGRCPLCGGGGAVDVRPWRVRRAEMFEQSTRPARERAEDYLRTMVAVAARAKVPEARRRAWAVAKSPEWVRMALTEGPAGGGV